MKKQRKYKTNYKTKNSKSSTRKKHKSKRRKVNSNRKKSRRKPKDSKNLRKIFKGNSKIMKINKFGKAISEIYKDISFNTTISVPLDNLTTWDEIRKEQTSCKTKNQCRNAGGICQSLNESCTGIAVDKLCMSDTCTCCITGEYIKHI